MTNSYKKNSYCWIGSESAKKDKSLANRKLRRRVNTWLSKRMNEGLLTSFSVRDVSDPWGWGVDGKKRFNADKYPHLMRK